MQIQIDSVQPAESIFITAPPSSTLIIDNGTYTCKAGFPATEPQVIFRNRLYKYKDEFSLDAIPSSSLRTMFEKDVIINMEILEGTIDQILKHLTRPSTVKKKRTEIEDLIFTLSLDTPHHFISQVLSLLFDVYKFNRIQFGPDLYYSYLKNIKKEIRSRSRAFDVVVSVSYSSTIVFLIQDDDIKKAYKLGFGAQLAGEYLLALINNKYSDISFKMALKDTEHLLKYTRCGMDYNEDSLAVLSRLRNGEIEYVVVSNSIKYYDEEEKPAVKKKWVKRIPKKAVAKEQVADNADDEKQNSDEEETEDTKSELGSLTVNPDENVKPDEEGQNSDEETKPDEDLKSESHLINEELIKEQRRQKMIYYSSMYRFKQKIEKQMKKLKMSIEHLEEDLEKTLNIDKYLDKIRNRYTHLKREIKLRNQVRRELKNNKSVEFLIMMKVNNGLTLIEPEERIYHSIKEATDEELTKIMEDELEKYRKILLEMDPIFLYDMTPINILRADHLNLEGFCIDLELLKIPEILFEPSIIGMSQPGLKEIFEDIRGLELKNVLLTGGFSSIKNLDKRIEMELTQNSLNGGIRVVRASNPEYDAFYGAEVVESLPVYTREEYEAYGADELIRKYNKFI